MLGNKSSPQIDIHHDQIEEIKESPKGDTTRVLPARPPLYTPVWQTNVQNRIAAGSDNLIFLRSLSFRWCSGQVEIITRSACEPNLPSTGLSTNIYQMPWYVLKKYERAGLGKMEYCTWKQTFSRTLYWTCFWMMKNSRLICPSRFPNCFSPQNTPCRRTTKTMEPIICPWGYASFKMVFPLHASKNTLWSLCSIYTLMSQSGSNHLLFISLKHKPLLEMSRNYLHAIWFKGALQKLGFQSSHQKEAAFSGPSLPPCNLPAKQKRDATMFSGCFFPQIYKSPGFRISQVKFQRWDHFPIWDGPILSDLFSYCTMIAYKSMWKFEVQISVQ